MSDDYANRGRYVRYEVKTLTTDCSWDQMMTLWNSAGELESYTFIHESGRNVRVAASMHIEYAEIESSGDVITEHCDEVLAFLDQMEVGDSVETTITSFINDGVTALEDSEDWQQFDSRNCYCNKGVA